MELGIILCAVIAFVGITVYILSKRAEKQEIKAA